MQSINGGLEKSLTFTQRCFSPQVPLTMNQQSDNQGGLQSKQRKDTNNAPFVHVPHGRISLNNDRSLRDSVFSDFPTSQLLPVHCRRKRCVTDRNFLDSLPPKKPRDHSGGFDRHRFLAEENATDNAGGKPDVAFGVDGSGSGLHYFRENFLVR